MLHCLCYVATSYFAAAMFMPVNVALARQLCLHAVLLLTQEVTQSGWMPHKHIAVT